MKYTIYSNILPYAKNNCKYIKGVLKSSQPKPLLKI